MILVVILIAKIITVNITAEAYALPCASGIGVDNWKNIDKYAIYLDVVSVCVISVFVIWFIINIRKRSGTNQKREIPRSD